MKCKKETSLTNFGPSVQTNSKLSAHESTNNQFAKFHELTKYMVPPTHFWCYGSNHNMASWIKIKNV
jgi:hypothetical protein